MSAQRLPQTPPKRAGAERRRPHCHSLHRYADFDALKPVLAKQLSYGDNLLLVGPGTSALHEKLYDR